jgi:endonuclease III
MQMSLNLGGGALPQTRDRLLAAFGPQRPVERMDPISQLVKSSISGRTHDEVSWAAFLRLHAAFDTWEALSRTSPLAVLDIIHDVTHAEDKARRLPHALRLIKERVGELSLVHLKAMDIDAARWWLQGLPGVGVKTAASVLNFSTLAMRALVVDTHVHRVAKRLGLADRHHDTAHGYAALMTQVPDSWTAEDLFELHWLMKGLGKVVCTHFDPACGACPLRDACPRLDVDSHPRGQVLAWRPRPDPDPDPGS